MRKNKDNTFVKNKVDNIYLDIRAYKKGATYNDLALIKKMLNSKGVE